MNNSPSIRVLAVDNQALLREGIAGLIGSQPDMTLVAEASNGRDAIAQFRLHRPDVTLMDLLVPQMEGVEVLVAIREEFPNARVVVLTTSNGDVQASRALKAGACGFLLKAILPDDLLETIRAVHRGEKRIVAEVAAQLADHVADDTLTTREIEVLELIAEGNSNKLIADQLSISEDTAKGHVKNILSKLGANDRTHAVTIGLKRGIIALL